METREKLIRLLPGFFFLLTILGFFAAAIFPRVFLTPAFFIVPFIASFASRIYCLRKFPIYPKWESVYKITVIIPTVLAVFAIIISLTLSAHR